MNDKNMIRELHTLKKKQMICMVFLTILTGISGISIFWNFVYGSMFDTSVHILILAGAWIWIVWEYSEIDNRIEQIYLTLCKDNKA